MLRVFAPCLVCMYAPAPWRGAAGAAAQQDSAAVGPFGRLLNGAAAAAAADSLCVCLPLSSAAPARPSAATPSDSCANSRARLRWTSHPPPHIYPHTHTSLQGLKQWELSCSYSKVLQLLSVFHTGNPLFSTWLQRLWSSGLLHLQELFHHQLSLCCFCEAATFIKLNEMLVSLIRHFCLVMLSLKCDDTAVQTEGKKTLSF